MRRSSIVALAAALLPALINGQGASSMHPIDFDGDGDIDIVKSSPIGIVWLENHRASAPGAPEKTRVAFSNRRRQSRWRGGVAQYSRVYSSQVDKEWETHIISLNQNIKDAVAAHKRHRKFVDVARGRGFAPVSALSRRAARRRRGRGGRVPVDVGGEVGRGGARYAERELRGGA